MGVPIFIARLRITNSGGTWDSLADGGEQPRIVAKASATLSNEPNTAEIGVYNLAPDMVARIQAVTTKRLDWSPAERAELLAKGASIEPLDLIADGLGLGTVELSWGYVDSQDLTKPALEAALSVGYTGQMTTDGGPEEVISGNDRVLTMLCQDAGNTLGAAEVVQEAGGGQVAFEGKSYAVDTRIADILVDLINSMGVSADAEAINTQIVNALAARGFPGADARTLGGYNASGPARPQIEAILGSLGLRWSVQNGELLIAAPGEPLAGFLPLMLSTGLANVLGEPQVQNLSISVTTQATTSAIPGRQTDIRTADVDASYIIDQADTSFDSWTGGVTVIKGEGLGELVAGL